MNNGLFTATTLALNLLMASLAPTAEAAEEAVLNVYNWSDYIGAQTLQQFTAETGIRVNYDTFDSLEMLETKLLAGGSNYDVVVAASSVLQLAIPAGALQPLDRQRLSGYQRLAPDLLAQLTAQDPGNAHGVPYTWGTTGLGVNVEAVRQRLPTAPLDSLDLLFDPAQSAALADCGIALIDSPQEVLAMTLNHLGHAPDSADASALKAAAALLAQLRPNVEYINTGRLINDLAEGEICLALTYSGDVAMAALRAGEAGKPFELRYRIPREGALIWFDTLAIPVDAPQPVNAHRFIDFMLRPAVIAEVSNTIWYANANRDSLPLLDAAVRDDPGIYPSAAVRARLFEHPTLSPKATRKRTRVWTRFVSQR